MAKQQKRPEAPRVEGESMEEEIRSLAYQLYCESGYQDGRDHEHWLQAEQRVKAHKKAHLRNVA